MLRLAERILLLAISGAKSLRGGLKVNLFELRKYEFRCFLRAPCIRINATSEKGGTGYRAASCDDSLQK
jgi:hypothetical protein